MQRGAKLTLALALVALAVFASGCGVLDKLKARDELNKGVRSYKAANFEAAIEHFKLANELDPTLLNAQLYLAIAYRGQCTPGSTAEESKRNCDASIAEFGKILESHPENVTALGYLAQLYYDMAGAVAATDWAQASQLFGESKDYRRRLINLDPSNPEHYYSIGVVDWAIAYRQNAEIRRKIGRQQDEPLPAKDRRELVSLNSEVVEEGITMLKKATELNPNYIDAIAYLNLIYRQKADIVESPREREQWLQAADDMHERYQKLREQQQQKPAPATT